MKSFLQESGEKCRLYPKKGLSLYRKSNKTIHLTTIFSPQITQIEQIHVLLHSYFMLAISSSVKRLFEPSAQILSEGLRSFRKTRCLLSAPAQRAAVICVILNEICFPLVK